jgi:cytochrome bd-type quinol oxidase subunit 2
MKSIFGLPAHPLVVHLAVVLVPITALAVIVAAVRPSFRRRYHVHLFALSVVGLLATFAARKTGEEMFKWMNQDPPVAHHRDLANVATVLTFLFVLATGAMTWIERRSSTGDGSKRTATMVTSAVAAVVGLLVIVWVARTGHEGARLTWQVTVQGK